MIDYVSEACGYLLPCGMCRITMQSCPKFPCKVEPTWITTMAGPTTTEGTGTITVNAKGEVQKNAAD